MPSHVTFTRLRAVALLSAIFGTGVSIYLLVEYTTGQAGLCLTGAGCDAVRASEFAYPFGVPMPLFGVAFYAVAAGLAARESSPLPLAAWAGTGAAVSVLLTGIEAFVIDAYCTWCLVSAATSGVLFVASVGLARVPIGAVGSGRSSRVRHQLARASADAQRGLRRAAVAGTLATTVLFGALLAAGGATAGPAPQASSGLASDLAPEGRPRLGAGPVAIVEFADFQCPGCAVVGPLLTEMAARDEVTLVFRHFPLEQIHANANAAGRAAEAAGRQGAFFPMGDLLYARQAEWSRMGAADADAAFERLAVELGLDVGRWREDYASPAVHDAVAADAAAARALKLSGTPTLYIGGQPYTGPLDAAAIRAAVAAAG